MGGMSVFQMDFYSIQFSILNPGIRSKWSTLPVTMMRFSCSAVAPMSRSKWSILVPACSNCQRILPYSFRLLVMGYCSNSVWISATSLKCYSRPDLKAPKYISANVISEILHSLAPTCRMCSTTLGIFLIKPMQIQVSNK